MQECPAKECPDPAIDGDTVRRALCLVRVIANVKLLLGILRDSFTLDTDLPTFS